MISERQLLDLDVELWSPVVVVPEGGVRSEGGRVIVVNCGSLCVTSSMQHYVPDVKVGGAFGTSGCSHCTPIICNNDVSMQFVSHSRKLHWRSWSKHFTISSFSS